MARGPAAAVVDVLNGNTCFGLLVEGGTRKVAFEEGRRRQGAVLCSDEAPAVPLRTNPSALGITKRALLVRREPTRRWSHVSPPLNMR